MIKYSYIMKGRNRLMPCSSLSQALRIAANHHESGTIPYEIVTDTQRYSQSEILLMCKRYGYL